MRLSTFIWILCIAAAGIIVYSIYYTLVIARTQKAVNQYDGSVDEKVQSHPYFRNPVFIAFIVFFLLMGLLIMYFSFK
ncbi:hypothetical protein SAMN05443252_101544 [Bacillus sp. OV322]|nr:hypothetical protein SAMN05443252_101544 [Bacillus sp. OV322]